MKLILNNDDKKQIHDILSEIINEKIESSLATFNG